MLPNLIMEYWILYEEKGRYQPSLLFHQNWTNVNQCAKADVLPRSRLQRSHTPCTTHISPRKSCSSTLLLPLMFFSFICNVISRWMMNEQMTLNVDCADKTIRNKPKLIHHKNYSRHLCVKSVFWSSAMKKSSVKWCSEKEWMLLWHLPCQASSSGSLSAKPLLEAADICGVTISSVQRPAGRAAGSQAGHRG